LVLRPKPKNHRGDFDDQITKPKMLVLRPKPGNPPPPWFLGSTKKPSAGFEAKLGETVATSFEAKLEKTVVTSFEAKREKTVVAGFEAKPLQIVAAGFEAKPPETVLFISPSKMLNDYYASNA
jgi:alkanesulfonate monooxygenase SsuD/methylene tetrahydromethanopterin reductase-like flavin-dependent oxidoreductase (luciferase family)